MTMEMSNSDAETLCTQGDWKVSYLGGMTINVVVEEGNVVKNLAHVTTLLERGRTTEPSAEDWANALLFAASKQLLKALKGCLFALDESLDGAGPTREQAIADAEAAIALTRMPNSETDQHATKGTEGDI